MQSVHRTLSLPQSSRPVLGADLNLSELVRRPTGLSENIADRGGDSAVAEPFSCPAGWPTESVPLRPEQALKDVFKECATCPEMVVVPAGSFTMGSPTSEVLRESNESPQHAVTFARQLAVGRFALSFDEWMRAPPTAVARATCRLMKVGAADGGR